MEKKEPGAAVNTTEYYGLVKPGPDDFYDVEVGNRNMDEVDTALKGLDDQKADQEAVDAALVGVNGNLKNIQKIAEGAKVVADKVGETAATAKATADAAVWATAEETRIRAEADTAMQDNIKIHVTDSVKHVSVAERNAWNAKAGTSTATGSNSGLMAAADKVKLDAIAAQANKTVIANNLTTTISGSALDAAQGAALSNTMNAHSADIVKHITAPERTAWNEKAGTAVATSAISGLMAAADKTKLDGIAAQANKTVIANNLTTTTAGSALDATQGKVISERIGALDTNLESLSNATMISDETVALYGLSGDLATVNQALRRNVYATYISSTRQMSDIIAERANKKEFLSIRSMEADDLDLYNSGDATKLTFKTGFKKIQIDFCADQCASDDSWPSYVTFLKNSSVIIKKAALQGQRYSYETFYISFIMYDIKPGDYLQIEGDCRYSGSSSIGKIVSAQVTVRVIEP